MAPKKYPPQGHESVHKLSKFNGCLRCLEDGSGRGPEDRLSALPDPLIQLILSFLPTNESARTSVLARRWLHLWTFIPNLHLELRRCRDIHKARTNNRQFRTKCCIRPSVTLNSDRCMELRELKALQLESIGSLGTSKQNCSPRMETEYGRRTSSWRPSFEKICQTHLSSFASTSGSSAQICNRRIRNGGSRNRRHRSTIFSNDGLHELVLRPYSVSMRGEQFCLDVPKLPVLSDCKAFNSLNSIHLYLN
ncbi:putative F-box/FBD/LRR-repeat protein [Nymphaea thermarum]|nr:putative F-box/FBD/LRR-repeat protein [Nymphaea thermarum]